MSHATAELVRINHGCVPNTAAIVYSLDVANATAELVRINHCRAPIDKMLCVLSAAHLLMGVLCTATSSSHLVKPTAPFVSSMCSRCDQGRK